MIYIAIFLILFAFAVAETRLNGRSKMVLQTIAWLVLVFVAGTRYETGGDWDVYTYIFEEEVVPFKQGLSSLDFGAKHIELVFVLLCSVVKQLGGSIQWVFFIITLVNISILWFVLRRTTKYVLFGMLAYYSICYFALDMLYTRQSTSVLLVLLAILYADDWKDWWKYMLVVVLAAVCHRMALIMIPVYLLLHKAWSDYVYLGIIGLGCVFMLFGIKWLIPVFVGICDLLGESFSMRALYYTKNLQFAVQRGVSIGFVLNLLLFLLFAWKRKAIFEHKYGVQFFNMFIMSLVIYYYGYELIEVSNRFRFYFFISLVILFPMLIEVLEWTVNKLIVGIVIVGYLFLYSRAIFLGKPEAIAYHPYQNYIVYTIEKKFSTGSERLEKSIQNTRQNRKVMKKN